MGKSSISVFIPFYNEETVVEDIVEESLEFLESLERDFELVFVDDGSTDQTTEKLEAIEKNMENVKLVVHSENLGYGNALKTGFENCSNPLIAYIDGDGQFNIEDIEILLEEIDHNDIVAGIRRDREDSVGRKVTGKGFNLLVRNLFDVDFEDIDCGIKLVREEVIEEIELNTDRTVDAELLIKAERQGFDIEQVEVSHYRREEGESEASGLIGVRTGLILTTLKEIKEIRDDIK